MKPDPPTASNDTSCRRSNQAGRHLGLIALLAFVACRTTTPPPVLEAEPPSQWSTVSSEDASTAPPPVAANGRTDAWWQAFDDEQLDALLREVLARNPTLAAARANVRAAIAQARLQGADLRPQIGAGVSWSRRKQNFIGLPIPGTEGSILSTTSSNAGLSLTASWEADLWGRLSAQRQGALASSLAASQDLAAAQLSLTARAAHHYFGATEATHQVELLEATLASRKQSERWVRARYDRGLVSSLDLRLARTQSATLEAQIAQQRQAADRHHRQLEVLAGRHPHAAFETPSRLPILTSVSLPPIPASVLARRPDLRALEQRAFAANAELAAARRARYPSLTLNGSTGTASDSLSDLLDGDFSVWSLAAGLLQPLFQGGRIRAGIELAEAGVEGTMAQWLEGTLNALAEVESALAADLYVAEQTEALTRAANESRAAETLALRRYNNGLADYLTVLESQRAALQAERQLLQAKRLRLDNRVNLLVALAGPIPSSGTDNSTATNTERSAPATAVTPSPPWAKLEPAGPES